MTRAKTMDLYGVALMKAWRKQLIWTGSGREDMTNFIRLDTVMV
ncbi:hypothetical protein IC582_022698 [Cucumis melo]